MVQHLWIPGRVPGLNEILEARALKVGGEAPGSGKRHDGYGRIKRFWKRRVELCAAAAALKPMTHAHFLYLLVEPLRNRDPSNIAAGALKLIEDGLQGARVLPNDGWKQVKSFQVRWVKGKEPGTHVWLAEGALSSEQVDQLIGGVCGE